MADSDIERKMSEVREQIARLESSQQELERSLADIDHQRRRVSDRLERSGGDREAEAEQARLRDNRAANRRDFQRNSEALERLHAEAEDLQRRIDELRGRS